MRIEDNTLDREVTLVDGVTRKLSIAYQYRTPEDEADVIDLCGSLERGYEIIGARNAGRISSMFTPAVIKSFADKTQADWDSHVREAQNKLLTGNLAATRGEGNTAATKLGTAVQEAVKNLDPNASAEEKLAALRAAGVPI